MNITTEKAILTAIQHDAREILSRASRYEYILNTSKDEKEAWERIKRERLPELDEGCMYTMITIPAKCKVDFLGGVQNG